LTLHDIEFPQYEQKKSEGVLSVDGLDKNKNRMTVNLNTVALKGKWRREGRAGVRISQSLLATIPFAFAIAMLSKNELCFGFVEQIG